LRLRQHLISFPRLATQHQRRATHRSSNRTAPPRALRAWATSLFWRQLPETFTTSVPSAPTALETLSHLSSAWITSDIAQVGLTHPGFLGKLFMLGPTNRAVNAREEDRGGIEAFAVGNDASRNIASRLWAFDHDGPHRTLPVSYRSIPRPYATTV